MFKQFKINYTKSLYLVFVILIAWVIFEYIYALFYATVDSDAGYCLALARDITDGKTLYKDIVLHYTPFVIYLFSLIKILSGSLYNYTIILLFQFIVIGFDSFLVYKIASLFTKNKLLVLYSVAATLLMFFRYDGVFLELEPFVIFFSLMSIYFVFKSDDRKLYFILAGIAGGLSFFSKQFGVFVFIPISIYILIYEGSLKKSFVKLLYLALGAIIPLSLFLLYYSVIYDVPVLRLFDILTGEGVQRFSENYYVHTMRNFIFYNGIFLFFIPVYFVFQEAKSNKYLFLFILLFLIFSISLLFGSWDHYKQFFIPYIVLIALLMFDKAKEIPALSNFFKLLIFLCFLFILASNIKYFADNYKTWDRQKQYQIAKELKKIIPENSKVFCVNKQAYIFLCNYQSADPVVSGYPYIGEWNETRVRYLLNQNEILIYYKQIDYKQPGYFQQLLNEFNFVNTEITDSEFFIWRKRKF